MFGISIFDPDLEDESDSLVTDVHTHIYYEGNAYVNQMLIDPCSEGIFEPFTTGQLKMVPRILLWLVPYVLRPKNGEFSRIDYSEVHLVYILLNKVKINWPHYIVSRMFAINKCNKGTSFIYVYMISKILKFFNIGLPSLSYKSLGSAQDFSQRTLTTLGYFWDVQRRVYYLLPC